MATERRDSGNTSDIITIPDPSAVPKTGSLPVEQFGKINNLAGDDKLTQAVAAAAQENLRRFMGQTEREAFTKSGGTLDQADKMYRATLVRDTTNDQHQNTQANVSSTSYHRYTNVVTAALNKIFFNGEELPAKYDEEVNIPEDTFKVEGQGATIATQRNRLSQYTWDEDERERKIRDGVLFTLKNTMTVWSNEWRLKEEMRMDKVPTGFDPDTGQPLGFEWVEKKKTLADWPTLIRHDIKDCFFDAQISDLQKQQWFIVKKRRPYEELVAEQDLGRLKNVDKIGLGHQEIDEQEDVVAHRSTNASVGATIEESGLIEEWHVWGMMPIKEYKRTRKGHGKWDAKKQLPQRYWATFAGNLEAGSVTCTRLILNPYIDKKIPYFIWYSHPDEKGAFHLGNPNLVENLYWQAVTNRNQYYDCINKRVNAFYTIKGRIHARGENLIFRQNRLVQLDPNSELERFEPGDTTARTQESEERTENDMAKTMLADKPVSGEQMFSRTSAQESKQNLDQALAPIDEQASYMSEFFKWLWDSDYWRWKQYGKADTIRMMTGNDMVVSVNPGVLWGPVKTKVTCVTRFRNTIQARQEMNNFFQNVLPQFAPVMGKSGIRVLARQAFRRSKFDDIEHLVPIDAESDARANASSENYAILVAGQQIEPKEGENHEVHKVIHNEDLRDAKLVPDFPEERITAMELHISGHDRLEEQEVQQTQAGAQQQSGQPQRELDSEIASIPLEAAGGATAQQ